MIAPLTEEEQALLAALQAKQADHIKSNLDKWFFYNIQRGEIAQQLRENAADVIELLRPFVEYK